MVGTACFGEQVRVTDAELRSQLITNTLLFGIWFWFSFIPKGGVSLPHFV